MNNLEVQSFDLKKLISIYQNLGVSILYVKPLAANDNSKNQLYLGSDFSVIHIIPHGEIYSNNSSNARGLNWKANVEFLWVDEEGRIWDAPNTQLILYPQYPEVRMSGFLRGCKNPPSELMNSRLKDRLLFLGIDHLNRVIAFVSAPDSVITYEWVTIAEKLEQIGVFLKFPLGSEDARGKLLSELKRIHLMGWIEAKRLNSSGEIVPCRASNCGGYTLEAELGIKPNAFSEPDFRGWELKQYGVTSFSRPSTKPITLMTPEPTGGFYNEFGVEKFVRRYGYPDKHNRPDRLNFGGIFKAGIYQQTTQLTLMLLGYDSKKDKVIDADGGIALIDADDKIAAIWHYTGLIKHWNRKHALAAYVPSMRRSGALYEYFYGPNITLGEQTDFLLFLRALHDREVYYDPGIKLENSSTNPKVKRRSQFRINFNHLNKLYVKTETVNLLE